MNPGAAPRPEGENVQGTLLLNPIVPFKGDPYIVGFGVRVYLPLVSRGWKRGSNSSYTCTPFLHSLLTKGRLRRCRVFGGFSTGLGSRVRGQGFIGLQVVRV